jgi:uncharacterized protein YqfB (UPF0267 family)
MIKTLVVISFILLSKLGASQKKCEWKTMTDTIVTLKKETITNGEVIETTFKNKSILRLYKFAGEKYYLKLFVTENLYFDKIDNLEIQSGNKSFYEKATRQNQVDKSSAYYVVEIYRNYVATLRDEGITGIVFGKAQTDFTRQDASQVRQIAKCFYEDITQKK